MKEGNEHTDRRMGKDAPQGHSDRMGRNLLQGNITWKHGERSQGVIRGQRVKEEGPKIEKECSLRREALKYVRSSFIQSHKTCNTEKGISKPTKL